MAMADAIPAGLLVAARSLADADSHLPLAFRREAQPILLLQGFAASSRVLLPLEAHLRRTLGRPVVRVRLGHRLPIQLGDIRRSAGHVAAALGSLARVPGFDHADLVGHSMGGLVATYVLKRLERAGRIRRVITLGTPHRGTPLALAGALLLGAFARALADGSGLAALARVRGAAGAGRLRADRGRRRGRRSRAARLRPCSGRAPTPQRDARARRPPGLPARARVPAVRRRRPRGLSAPRNSGGGVKPFTLRAAARP
jgi:pimeloyl-ACP methyl ester carboxylesterase